tara:strand:+ start:73 stop:627 length:555 start_codon:yes stop_codon:yes gene_type:complete
MANIDAAFGFRPSGKVGGNPDNGALSQYRIEDGLTDTLFQGDLVHFTAGYIVDAAAGDPGCMVFNGIQYDDPTTGKPTFKNQYDGVDLDKDIDCFVYDDPYQVYEVQSDTGTATTQAMVGTFMDHEEDAAGNTTTGLSGDEVDASTSGTSLLTVKMLGIAKTPGNALGTNSVIRCYISEPAHTN